MKAINLLTFQFTRLSMIMIPARVAVSGKFLHFPVTMTPVKLWIFLHHCIAEIFCSLVNFLGLCLRIEAPVIEVVPGHSCIALLDISLSHWLETFSPDSSQRKPNLSGTSFCNLACLQYFQSSLFWPNTKHQD